MRTTVLTTAGFLLLLSAPTSAHRLDEYLQAARVMLASTSVALEMDLTPGASVADAVIALVDRDADKTITLSEAKAYGEAVLSDLIVELDGSRVSMTLSHAEVPSFDEMRDGVGVIQLRAIGEIEYARGARQLRVRNHHQPHSGVYLVNALISSDPAVAVIAQLRDARQQDVRIDYRVTPQWPKLIYWPIFGLVIGGWWFMRARGTHH